MKLGAVLERSNQVEDLLSSVISIYVCAQDDTGDEFLRRRLLHNSVVHYGAKVKLTMEISSKVQGRKKLDEQALRTIGVIRNAFAHARIASSVRTNQNALTGRIGEYLIVEPIKSDGSTRELRRDDALKEFNEAYHKIRPQLDQLIDAIGPDRTRP